MNPGERILSYEIERKLGQGGMASVYLARHPVLGQQVAVKVLDMVLARNSDVRERFIQEASIQSQLKHPGIVQLLTAQVEGEQLAMVMEYVDGAGLDQVIERRGALPVHDAVQIMEQVLAAVDFAHARGVVHRDLKPSNVMVCGDGTAKVTDFGIAKVAGANRLTSTGTAMGTAHYMSPEQVIGAKSVDQTSDVYSLGCVFYEMLTGQPPFGHLDEAEGGSDFRVKEGHVRGEVPDLAKMCSNVPASIQKIVMQALSKDPGARPQSCAQMLESLQYKKENSTVDEDPPLANILQPIQKDYT